MTPYDEAEHRRKLGLVPVQEGHATTIEAPLDLVDVLDEQLLDAHDPASNGRVEPTPPA